MAPSTEPSLRTLGPTSQWPFYLTHLQNYNLLYRTNRWKDITIKNVTGTSRGNRIFWAKCSKLSPCHDWKIEGLSLTPGKANHPEISYVCNNFVLGPQDGLNGCHPSDSDLETDSGGTV